MEYTELEILSHANVILGVAVEQETLKEMKPYILAAQHKLDLLREAIRR